MFDKSEKLGKKAREFADDRNLSGTRRQAVIISQRDRVRVRFLTKSVEKQWVAYCKEFNIPNDETLKY